MHKIKHKIVHNSCIVVPSRSHIDYATDPPTDNFRNPSQTGETKTELSHFGLADSELYHFRLVGHMFSHVDVIIM
jgi:hypothetical protein